MIRHCDGKDEFLSKIVEYRASGSAVYVPCDCGLTFDDVKKSTIYPHQDIKK